MADQLNPGTHADTPGSQTMAKAMEQAFFDQWPAFNGDRPQPRGDQRESLRLFFVAVAQGVVQHLRDNPTAFQVDVDSSGGAGGAHDHNAEVDRVNTTNTTG